MHIPVALTEVKWNSARLFPIFFSRWRDRDCGCVETDKTKAPDRKLPRQKKRNHFHPKDICHHQLPWGQDKKEKYQWESMVRRTFWLRYFMKMFPWLVCASKILWFRFWWGISLRLFRPKILWFRLWWGISLRLFRPFWRVPTHIAFGLCWLICTRLQWIRLCLFRVRRAYFVHGA